MREIMQEEILITFFNKGLRSYIEVDLCANCPRQDNKGCCGYYSPIFYSTDLAYLLENKPELVDWIFALPDITVLDASVTVNNTIEGDSYKCQFHTTETGCLLDQTSRETICRHFVCPGIDWKKEDKLSNWENFFKLLLEYEIKVNNNIARIMKERGFTLRNLDNLDAYFAEMMPLFHKETKNLPSFFNEFPAQETFKLIRTLSYGEDWPL